MKFLPAGIIPNLISGFCGLNAVAVEDVLFCSSQHKTALSTSLNIPSPPTEIILQIKEVPECYEVVTHYFSK